jgi:hypothetical protein
MKLSNDKIYTYAIELQKNFQDEDQKLPVKIGFYLQKNKTALLTLAQDIEETRTKIIRTYGEYDSENNNYIIAPEKIEDASKELDDLFKLEQEVQIYTISIDTFPEDLSFTSGQMEAIMFMID